jgi:hypothetical protein
MPKSKTTNQKSHLVLGWQVTPTLEPKYWLNPAAKPGKQSPSDLVAIPPDLIASHTAIIAQSGSGKSFFLGRLIEEIVLKTRARCIIFDPNADFKKFDEVEKDKLWKEASYDLLTRRGKLPHEGSRRPFKDKWSSISMLIKSKSIEPQRDESSARHEQLKLRWTSVSVDFFADDADSALRSELYHCHAFVQALEPLLAVKPAAIGKQLDLIDEAEGLLAESFRAGADFKALLQKKFIPEEIANPAPKKATDPVAKTASEPATKTVFVPSAKPLPKTVGASGTTAALKTLSFLDRVFQWLEGFSSGLLGEQEIQKLLIEDSIDRLAKAAKYVTEEGARIYFGRVSEFKAEGILETLAGPPKTSQSASSRLEVIDLPSLVSTSTRLLAINALVAKESQVARAAWWKALTQDEKEDDRVPTFFVIDEAHNLLPAKPQTKAEFALREQFRTIVAEGRKYGLFLILVSQRPDKLDPLVVSECENRVVMKLSSRSVVEITRKRLGLEDISPKLLERTIDFEMGRGLLIGPWALERPQLFYSAARRTIEGGRNLRKEHWANPPAFGHPPSTTKQSLAGKVSKKPVKSKGSHAVREISGKNR